MTTEKHLHHCPGCYQVWECTWDCTIEPDLEDPDTYPNMQFGSHCKCNECEPPDPPPGVDKYNTKEFWDVYNGFIKVKKKKYVVR